MIKTFGKTFLSAHFKGSMTIFVSSNALGEEYLIDDLKKAMKEE